MSMNKIANINLETTADYQSLSGLNVQFWNQDKGTAVLQFNITRNNYPLGLSTENVKVFIALESGDSFLVDDNLDYLDELNGVVAYTIPNEFMRVATSVKGQVYVTTLDEEEVVVQRQFTFNVSNDLIADLPAEDKIREIKYFSDMRAEVAQMMEKLNNDFANMNDYVTQVEQTTQDGITALTNLINTKQDAYNANHTAKLKELNDKGTEYSTKFDEDKQYIDEKSQAFKDAVNGSGVVTTAQSANWQKSKLTNDDGRLKQLSGFDFDNPELLLGEKSQFIYVSSSLNYPIGSSVNGTVMYLVVTTDYKRIEYRPNGSNKIFYRRKEAGVWLDWKELTQTQTDTGWVPFQLINGAAANTAFKADTDKGFDCAYRIEKRGSVTEKSIRINASKFSHSQQIAQLPENFVKSVQFHYVRAPINQGYGLVGVFPNGAVYVYIESDKRGGWDSTSQDYYFYGEFNWKE